MNGIRDFYPALVMAALIVVLILWLLFFAPNEPPKLKRQWQLENGFTCVQFENNEISCVR